MSDPKAEEKEQREKTGVGIGDANEMQEQFRVVAVGSGWSTDPYARKARPRRQEDVTTSIETGAARPVSGGIRDRSGVVRIGSEVEDLRGYYEKSAPRESWSTDGRRDRPRDR